MFGSCISEKSFHIVAPALLCQHAKKILQELKVETWEEGYWVRKKNNLCFLPNPFH